MRMLFEMDKKDYDINGIGFVRNSARCIAVSKSKVAMVYSRKYNYYKFPGGGIEKGEIYEEAMIREAREEAGLIVKPSSVKAYGYVHRIEKSEYKGVAYFLQDNYYYLCEVEEKISAQKLDDYEAEEGFVLRWVEPNMAIKVNREMDHGPKSLSMIEREARVLELMIEEGIFEEKSCNNKAELL